MYKRLQTLTLSALAWSPLEVRGPILKNYPKQAQNYGWKPWLAVFIVTCALGLAVVLDLFQNMCIVLLLTFVRYQQNRRQKVFNWVLFVCAREIDILRFHKKSTDL